MPADFCIDPQRKIVFSKAVDVFDMKDAVDHMDRLLADPRFRPEFSQLLDFMEVTKVNLTHDQVRGLAQRQVFSKESKRAFVVPNDLVYGMVRIFGSYREIAGETGIRLFRDRAAALEWLSIDREPDPSEFQNLHHAV